MQVNHALQEEGWQSLVNAEEIGLFFRDNGSGKRLTVTFDSLSGSTQNRPEVSGARLVRDIGCDHVHIPYAGTSWYQSEDVHAVIAAFRQFCNHYEDIILYGHSQGGYAALLFSGPFAATRVVALAPQYSVDPAKAPFENRFAAYVSGTQFVFDYMDETISRSAEKFIVFDPRCEHDYQHFKLYAAYPQVYPVRVPFGGHYPGQTFLEAGVIRPMISGLLLGTLDAAGCRRLFRAGRRRSHRYMVELAMGLSRRGDLYGALNAANAAYVLKPDAPSALESYLAILQCDGRWTGLSLALVRLLLKEQPTWTHYEVTKAALWKQLVEIDRLTLHAPQVDAVDPMYSDF